MAEVTLYFRDDDTAKEFGKRLHELQQVLLTDIVGQQTEDKALHMCDLLAPERLVGVNVR
jgi:hypothetical protein